MAETTPAVVLPKEALTNPKERAIYWSEKGVAWAASEWAGYAGLNDEERDRIVADAHERAAELSKSAADLRGGGQ